MIRAWIVTLLASLALTGCQTVPQQAGFSATQEAELRNLGFVEAEDGWELSLADRLLFDTDSAVVRADMHQALDRIASGLLAVGINAARIEGHTDSTGSTEHNAQLSGNRASAIAAALLTRGFSRERLAERGWGEARPVADNADENGRLLNRRVVIIVSPE